MSRGQRLAFLGIAAVIAVAAVLFFALGSSDEDSEQTSATATPTPAETATREPQQASPGEPTPTATPRRRRRPRIPTLVPGVVRELEAEQGETVRFRVVSPRPDEVHVHGYDLLKDVGPGDP